MKEERLLRALNEINDQYIKRADPGNAKARAVHKGCRPLRMAPIAAALAVLLTTAALAVHLLGGWETFFGKVPDNVTTPVGVSATSGEYTITLEETIVDQDGAAFLISLKRTDGGELEGKPATDGMWTEIVDRPVDMSFSYQPTIYSEDGKTAYYCFQFKNESEKMETLVGHQISLSYDGIIDEAWTQEEIEAVKLETVSLASLASVIRQTDVNFGIYADMLNSDFVTAMDLMDATAVPDALPLSKHGEAKWALAGGVLSRDGKTLALLIQEPNGYIREDPYLIRWAEAIALTDTRTGERVDLDDAAWNDSGFVTLFELERPLAPEDLPYLEATIEYDTVKYLSDEPFSLTFPVENTGRIREVAVDEDVSVLAYGSRYDLHITGIRVSALKVSLAVDKMTKEWGSEAEDDEVKLICDDGSEVPLTTGRLVWFSSGIPVEKDSSAAFFPSEWSDLIDPDCAVALQIGDARIDLK